MGRAYEYEETHNVELTVDGIVCDVVVSVEGWSTPGDSFGYGCEPPDGEEHITDIEFNYAYNEETDEDVTVTESLKKKVKKELESNYYW